MSVLSPSAKNIVFVVNPFRLRFLFVLLVALIGFSFSTFAQQATIVGTVTDPSGAVVPNVAVTITNTETGLSRTYPTNDAGQYVAPDLRIAARRRHRGWPPFQISAAGDRPVGVGRPFAPGTGVEQRPGEAGMLHGEQVVAGRHA